MKQTSDAIPSEQLYAAWLASRGLRKTAEREAVCRVALARKRPFEAADISGALEQEGFHVSVPTVYAALRTLVEASLLRRIAPDDDGPASYIRADLRRAEAVLLCTSCGKRRNVSIPELSRTLVTRSYRGFSASSVRAVIYGLCTKCRADRKALIDDL